MSGLINERARNVHPQDLCTSGYDGSRTSESRGLRSGEAPPCELGRLHTVRIVLRVHLRAADALHRSLPEENGGQEETAAAGPPEHAGRAGSVLRGAIGPIHINAVLLYMKHGRSAGIGGRSPAPNGYYH